MYKIGHSVEETDYTIPNLISKMEKLKTEGWGVDDIEGKKRYARFQAYGECLKVLRGMIPHKDIKKASEIDFLDTSNLEHDKGMARRAMMGVYLAVIRQFMTKTDYKPVYTNSPVLDKDLTIGSRVDFNVDDTHINPNYRMLRGRVVRRIARGVVVKVRGREDDIVLTDKMKFREFKSYKAAN